MDELIKALYNIINDKEVTLQNIKKEINNVNSEIQMRMEQNKNKQIYKYARMLGSPYNKIFMDGFYQIEGYDEK